MAVLPSQSAASVFICSASTSEPPALVALPLEPVAREKEPPPNRVRVRS